MITVDRCPLCAGGNLVELKRYRFLDPGDRIFESPASPEAYHHERLRIFFKAVWKSSGTAEMRIDLCESCGLIFSNPRFTPEEIKAKYAAIDGLDSAKEPAGLAPPRKTGERALRVHSLVTRTREEQSHPLKVLDYGGAEGFNLVPFAGEDRCYVLDYVRCSTYPDGVEYLGADVHVLEPGDRFDIILICHILEHAIKPQVMLSSLWSHLADGGLIYAEVPLGAFREWRTLKEPLTHVNFFSEESMCNCAEETGLEVLHLSTDYQWVTHGNLWCVNLLAGKPQDPSSRPVTPPPHKRTQQQMKGLRLFAPVVLNKLKKTVGIGLD